MGVWGFPAISASAARPLIFFGVIVVIVMMRDVRHIP